MDDERLARIEASIARLQRFVEIDSVYDLHRHIHEQASRESAAYVVSAMQGVPRFEDREGLFAHAATCAGEIGGDVLEFGVGGGASLACLDRLLPDRRLYGFDSFEGLPEDWSLTVKKGAYAVPMGKAKHAPKRAVLVAGWFSQSLPPFLECYDGSVAFVHIDCDLYSSTATVLEQLAPLLRPGCVIQFDEYFNYGGWQQHEFRAWQEFVAATGLRYEYLGYTRRAKAVAVRLLNAPNRR